MSHSFQQISIIGLGLMGGSLAKLIKQHHPTTSIFGVSRRQETIDKALTSGVITKGSLSIQDLPQNTELVIICSPISCIQTHLKEASDRLSKDVILTDIGSTKEQLCNLPFDLPNNHVFIGGHPMAGSQLTGIEHATADLLNGAPYILMKQETPQFTQLETFLSGLGFNVIQMTPNEHDNYVALASHIPYLMAGLTVSATNKLGPDQLQILSTLLAGGFQDTTRVASSDPNWGVDICVTNKKALKTQISNIQTQLETLSALIDTSDTETLKQYFQTIKDQRDHLLP
ncbi:hypothetical protein DID77_00855 [Candidatus Marinamargulisbacteria bacterium SCGC AG-439-L15]|nr:hypothetical protein DID77_00855 [Candidatus Marinamargulisbacteria bacterium SCGC AG-439-L15]